MVGCLLARRAALLDPSEQIDSDGDGVGDNSDDYPSDPTIHTRAPVLEQFLRILNFLLGK